MFIRSNFTKNITDVFIVLNKVKTNLDIGQF